MNQKDTLLLKRLGACDEAREWAKTVPSLKDAWTACPRADWMFWALREIGFADDRKYRLYACACVRGTPLADGRTLWDLLTDERSRTAVEVAERFAKGEATEAERQTARDAADASAASAAAYAAAAYAASAAAYAAASAARAKARAWQANLLRQWISWDEVAAAIVVNQAQAQA